MEENFSVSPIIAGEIIGTSAQFIRLGLQQGRLPFGTAVKNTGEWSYNISTKLLIDYIGEDRVKDYFTKKVSQAPTKAERDTGK